MYSKRLEREYIHKIASLINVMVEKDDRLVADFVSVIKYKRQERAVRAIEIAGVGISCVSMGLYALTKEQLPYMSAFASWAVSKAVEDFRVSHAVGSSEYSGVATEEISRCVQSSEEADFLKNVQQNGRMVVYKTIDHMAGDRNFVKKIESLQQRICSINEIFGENQ